MRRCVVALLCGLLAACGEEPEPAATPAAPRVVSGAVMKGAVQSATVEFYTLDAAGDPVALVATVTTDSNGLFSAALPNQPTHLLARTLGGSYLDESDPAPAASRRRIAMPASPTVGLESVLPPNATSFAITPYSNALLIKARLQAGGINFFNVFDAVRAQATTAFGFDPITTVPADPVGPSAAATLASRQYALLLGAASQAINSMAVSSGVLPDFSYVQSFINDLGSDGTFDLITLEEHLRRFRNNNFQIYQGVELPVLDEALLSQPATVPNARPVANADAIAVSEGGTATVLVSANTSVLDNDTDAEGSALTAAVGTTPVRGTLVLNTDGTFSYTHNGGETTSDSFTYTASDGTISSVAATVSISVAAVNDAPVAADDPGYTGTVGGTITRVAGAGGVRDNDTDPDDLTTNLSVSPVSGPSFAASFTLSADGGFIYQHDGSANLVDTFTYEVCDDDAVAPACDQAVATLTVSPAAANQVVLPYLDSAGDLKLFDPANPTTPILVESGLSTSTFAWRTLMKASVTAGVASNIAPARLVYISSDGTVKKVNLEPGQSRTAVQISNITDACKINGVAEDFATPDNSIVRIDTAGTDGTCSDGGGDDFTTAEAWLVPLSTSGSAPGVQVGVGHCCGITAIGNTSGALTGVLVAEDDGAGGTFFLRRRNVGSLATPAFSANLEIAGTGQVYGSLQRGMGDTHIYVRAVRFSIDTTYKILRFNVASNTLTAVYDYGISDGSLFDESFDDAFFDTTHVYFAEFDGSEVLSIPHTATTTTQFNILFTAPGGTKINGFEPAGNRLAIEASSADGTQGGVYSILKAGGSQVQLAANSGAPSTSRLSGVNGSLVLIDTIAGTASPAYTATAITADGATSNPASDSQWAGETFQPACDFNLGCEESIAASALYLRRQASTSNAELELANTTTGAATGTYVGTIFNVFEGPSASVLGFGNYGQVTVFASIEQSDLFLADSDQAAASPPGSALATVANAAGGGDNYWLLFDGEIGGGGGGADSDFDGLTDAQEIALGTDPNNPDTDADGLTDGDEVNTYGTDPTLADTDADGLDDGIEVGGATGATQPDTDGDGVGDGIEFTVGADPVSTINTVIYANAACAAGCDGTSWATGFSSQTDVETAIGAGDPTNMMFVLYAPGTYPSLALTDTTRTNVNLIGSLGPGVWEPDYPPTTEFDGQGSGPALRIADVVPIYVVGVDLTGGNMTTGGGLLLDVSTTPVQAYVIKSRIYGNTAEQGGGVAMFANAGTSDDYLYIEESEIFNNTATSSTSAEGGGIYMSDGSLTLEKVQLYNNIANNTTGQARGGGLFAETAGIGIVIDESFISGNTVTCGAGTTGCAGGGVYLAGSAQILFDLTRTKFLNNSTAGGVSPDSGGAGLYAQGDSRLSISEAVFADNRANNGPGGGVNGIEPTEIDTSDSLFLSNSSLRPGGGFHLHSGSSVSDTFNNLFVGNVSTDTVTDGGAVEIENPLLGPSPTFSSNTVAFNQTPNNATDAGGGVSFSNQADFYNNIVWFNQNSSPTTTDTGDNMRWDGSLGALGNNVQDPGMPGSISSNPVWAGGFYLDPVAPSPSIDAGDNSRAGQLLNGDYWTNPAGTPDGAPVDSGYHYTTTAGSLDFVNSPNLTVCPASSTRDIDVIPHFTGGSGATTQAGHVVTVKITSGVAATLSSLTTLQPQGTGSVLARDLGNGTYRFAVSGGSAGTSTVTVYVDNFPTQTVVISYTNAC